MKTEPIYQIQKENSNITHFIKETELIQAYLDYFNNFLTLSWFAQYYGYTEDSANFIIEKGKEILNRKP